MPDEEDLRTTALAFWRYAHDYLRAARTLCARHRVRCSESQVVYHLTAQSIEFALKAHLRAAGVSAQVLRDEIRHSLQGALDLAGAHGLAPLPAEVRTAIERMAPHHGDSAFVHVVDKGDEDPDVQPLFAAAGVLLDVIAPAVARDYVTHFARPESPSADELLQRLRADLVATSREPVV